MGRGAAADVAHADEENRKLAHVPGCCQVSR
jgi:hypothetical protein